MATLNPQILLAQQPVKMPSLDFSDTFVEMARIKAYQQATRLAELKYGQEERGYAREDEFNRLAAGLFTPPQAAPGAAPPGRGLAGGQPQGPGGPPPVVPPSMAGQVPPAPPGQSYAMAPGMAQGPPGPGGMPASFARAPEAMQPPMGGGQMPGMPPGLPAPASMEPGTFPMAPGGPQAPAAPRSLADAAPAGGPAAAPPPGGPAGLGTAQPGAPKSLLQPINEDVLMRLYAANPEKASKLMEGHLGMQTKKLEQAEKMNEQIYQTLSALERDPNPAARYPDALASLKERGIPIPASFPREYNAALIQFKLREHETLKNQLDTAKVEVERQRAANEKAQAGYHVAKTGVVPSEIAANKALAGQRGAAAGLDVARTGMVPTEIDAERALAEQRRAQAELDKARQTGIPTDIKAAEALVGVRNAEAELAKARTGGVPAEIKAAEALVELRKAEAARSSLQGKEDIARTTKIEEETTNLINERKAKLGQVTPYTTEAKQNVYLSQAAQELKLPPGTPPTPDVIALARRYQVEDQQNVVRKTGLDAAVKILPEVAQKRLQTSADKGSAAEEVDNVLDEVERLISEGVYQNIPEETIKMWLAKPGLRPDDAMSARTVRLYELGAEMMLARAGGKLGAGFSNADREAVAQAGGNLQASKTALERQETIKSVRRLSKINKQDANTEWKTYKETHDLPRFGAAREERLKILTPERLEEAYQGKKAQGWTKPQVREWWLQQGWREE